MNVLVVVDYQNDFVDGTLGFKEAVKLEKEILGRLEWYKKIGGKIVFTFDTHDENYLNTQEGKLLPVEHTIKGTAGWRAYGLVGKFLSENKDSIDIVEKNTFGALGLIEVLKRYDNQEKVESIEFCGVTTNMCEISNAVIAKATLPETHILINTDASSSFDMGMHYKALEVMKSMHMTLISK